MRKKSWFPFAAGAFLLGFVLCGVLPNGDEPEAVGKYEKARRATVLVQDLDGGSGSGVVVKRQGENGTRLFVWTAAHVIEGYSDVKIKKQLRYQGEKAGEMVFNAEVLDASFRDDVALLWLHAAPEHFEFAEFGSAVPELAGAPVFHIGNFYGADFDDSLSTGVISQTGVFPPDFFGWPWPLVDQATLAAVPGSSGGPVFSDSGLLTGLIVGGPTRGLDSIACFVPVRVIESWASRSALSWAVRGDACPSDDLLRTAAALWKASQPVTTAPVILVPIQ